MSDWSRKWKLSLNASKSEVCYFSSSTKTEEFLVRPIIKIGRDAIPFNPHPKLLGVTFDKSLTFRNHVKNVRKIAGSKTKLLSAVGNSKWGWQKQQLTQLYFAHVRTIIDYYGPGWQPWLSATNIKIIQSTQNKALRIFTGQLRSSTTEALRLGTGVETYEIRIKRTTLKSSKLARRLPAEHLHATAAFQ